MEIPIRELTELRALAAKRGLRGFSGIVTEALRDYLETKGEREREERRRQKTIDRVIGSISKEDAEHMRKELRKSREEKA